MATTENDKTTADAGEPSEAGLFWFGSFWGLDIQPAWWSYYVKVSFITNLFSRHRQVETESSPSVSWTGHSGKGYQYEVFPFETSFKALPGNYIYAGQTEDGKWVPIYIAQTRDLHQRLEGHVSVQDAMANGATHIHAHYCTAGQAARCTEEHDLVLQWQPVCNEPVEG